MYCANCGKQVPSISKFCPECGARIITANTASDAQPPAPQAVNSQAAVPQTATQQTPTPKKEKPRRRHGCLRIGGIIAGSVLGALIVLALIGYLVLPKEGKYTHPTLGFSFNYMSSLSVEIPDTSGSNRENPAGNPWFILLKNPSYQNQTVNWIVTYAVAATGMTEDQFMTELNNDVTSGAASVLTVNGIKMFKYVNDLSNPSQTLASFYKATGMDASKEQSAYIFIQNGSFFIVGFRNPPTGAPSNYSDYLVINSWNIQTSKTTTTPNTSTTTTPISGQIIATQSIGTSGGTIAVNKPGDSLDGFRLVVPAAALNDNKTFKVAYQAAPDLNYKGITAVSPLITIDDGGAFANQPVYLRIPVKIPQGDFAMAFYYDAKTGLEGMPLLGEDANSIIVATCHFSNFVCLSVSLQMLQDAETLANGIQTGFQPGHDDWEFLNYGSYITPNGNCAGTSMTEIYYFDQVVQNNNNSNVPRLSNSFTGEDATIWQDDILAYRLVSAVQSDYKVEHDQMFSGTKDLPLEIQSSVNTHDDIDVYNAFAFSMLITDQPQLIGVDGHYITNGQFLKHEMVAYAVTKDGIMVDDPNDRQGHLLRYTSGQLGSFEDSNTVWDTFYYDAKGALLSWDKIGERWQELYNGKINIDSFPTYTLTVADGNGQTYNLKDNLAINTDTMSLQVTSQAGLMISLYQNDAWVRTNDDGSPMVQQTWEDIHLNQGDNIIGIYVAGEKQVDNKLAWVWDDFKWVDINYGTATTAPLPTPTTSTPTPDITTTNAGADVTINTINSKFLGQDGSDYYYMVTVTGTASGPVGTGFAAGVEVLAESGGYATDEGYGDIVYQTTWSGVEEGYNDRIRSAGDPATTTWTFSVPIRISAPWNGNIVAHAQLDTFSDNYGPGGLKTIKKSYSISGPP